MKTTTHVTQVMLSSWGMPFTLDASKPAHTLAAGRFSGNRQQRRAQAAQERRSIRKTRVLDVHVPNAELSGAGRE